MVYERRTELNFIEATYIIVAKGIRLARHRLDLYYKTTKDIIKQRRKEFKGIDWEVHPFIILTPQTLVAMP